MGDGIIFGAKREAPKFGAGGVLPSFEKDALVVFGKYGDGVAVEEDLAAVVAELTYADQVVLEGGYDLASVGGKVA